MDLPLVATNLCHAKTRPTLICIADNALSARYGGWRPGEMATLFADLREAVQSRIARRWRHGPRLPSCR